MDPSYESYENSESGEKDNSGLSAPNSALPNRLSPAEQTRLREVALHAAIASYQDSELPVGTKGTLKVMNRAEGFVTFLSDDGRSAALTLQEAFDIVREHAGHSHAFPVQGPDGSAMIIRIPALHPTGNEIISDEEIERIVSEAFSDLASMPEAAEPEHPKLFEDEADTPKPDHSHDETWNSAIDSVIALAEQNNLTPDSTISISQAVTAIKALRK